MAINFPIVTTFDEKAVKKASNAFTALGRTFVGAFSIYKVAEFGKASVKAFSDAQQEARLLTAQLNSINLGFASPYLNEFIDKLSLATGQAGGDLTNAFVTLSQATGDVTTAQKILATALDVSLGTGKDLQTVSVALQRAYKGEITALAKLRIGFTTAGLKGRDFDEVLGELQKKFKGAAAAATDTYAVKMARLAEAVDQAKEQFGKGLVTALDESSLKVEELQTKIINLGTAFGDTTAAVIIFGDKTIDAFKRIEDSDSVQFVLGLFDKFTRFVVGPIIFGEFQRDSFLTTDAKRRAEANRKEEKAASARLRAANALAKAEKKITDEKTKQADKSKILNDINKRFEIDRIQIQAALGGEINDVERLRLELMKAILDEDVKRAIVLEGQLINAEAAAKELALLLDSLDTMVGDPFADWPGTITRIQELLSQLKIKVPIETLFAEKGLKLDQEKMTVTKLERMDVNANNVYINGVMPTVPKPADTGWDFNRDDPDETLKMALAVASDADALLAESEAALALLEAEAAAREAANAVNDAILAGLFAKLGLDAEGNPIASNTTVNVTVEGSVISEGDLVEMITDDIYRIQKTGKRITLSSLSI